MEMGTSGIRRTSIVALLLALGAGTGPSGQTSATPADGQAYTSLATAVLVDVVVRDRKGRPVTDLSAADFVVMEDGVRQSVDTFTRVSRGGAIGVNVGWRVPDRTVATPPTSEPADAAQSGAPDAVDATTALVFDHLSAESLRLAQRATLDYVPMSGDGSARVGVFAIGPGVRVVQPYTTDRTRVRRAVAQVMPGGTSAAEGTRERADNLLAQRRQLQDQPETSTAAQVSAAGGNLVGLPSSPGQREMELRLVQTELNMIRSFDNMDRDHRGYDTALALLSVVRTLAEYPGRKTIVFFSEGLPVSPVLSARLDAVIDAANRANVTAYAVDADGLRARSTSTELRREVDSFAEERMVQNATGVNRTEQPLTMAFERVEDTLTLGSRTGLARLARDTGGFLVEGSNDLSAAFRRIDEDHQFHYLLTYSPTNTAFDGKFRAIQVKVGRPGAQVFARRGYRPLRTLGGLAAGSFEAPALAILDRTPLPNAFPVHAAAFTFPDPGRPGLTPVLVQVGTGALRFTVDSQRGTYAGQAAIVVRIRDAQGQDVHKLSQEYLLAGEARDSDAARHGEILFYREVDLPPGVYSVESVVFDVPSGQASARRATLTVPDPERAGLGMSSLLLVDRIEEVTEQHAGERMAGPLYVGRKLLYPNLGTPIRRSEATELPFYFTVYGSTEETQARADLLRSGQTLAEAPVTLPRSSERTVQHVGRLPVGALPAGTYELRIRVTNGRQDVSRQAFFTLVD